MKAFLKIRPECMAFVLVALTSCTTAPRSNVLDLAPVTRGAGIWIWIRGEGVITLEALDAWERAGWEIEQRHEMHDSIPIWGTDGRCKLAVGYDPEFPDSYVGVGVCADVEKAMVPLDGTGFQVLYFTILADDLQSYSLPELEGLSYQLLEDGRIQGQITVRAASNGSPAVSPRRAGALGPNGVRDGKRR